MMSSKDKLRQEFNAHIRDEYIKQHPYCEYCGKPVKADHVHHIIPLIAGGDNRSSNLISLCVECHGKVHKKNFIDPKSKEFKEKQKAGIERAKSEGKYHGRKEVSLDNISNFSELYQEYMTRKLTKVEFAKRIEVSRPTLDRLLKKYERS